MDQIFGIDGAWLVHLLPGSQKAFAPLWARGIFGAVVVGLYFLLAPYLIHRICTLTEFSRRIYRRMTLLQIVTLQIFLVLMLSLPLKMLLRLLFRIKYVWVTPWFSI